MLSKGRYICFPVLIAKGCAGIEQPGLDSGDDGGVEERGRALEDPLILEGIITGEQGKRSWQVHTSSLPVAQCPS